jgi:hypothetical protein
MTEFRFDPPLTLKGNVVVHNLDDAVRFTIGIERRADLRCRRACYTALRKSPAKQTSAMPETHFVAGQRPKTSSSNSTNKRDRYERAQIFRAKPYAAEDLGAVNSTLRPQDEIGTA